MNNVSLTALRAYLQHKHDCSDRLCGVCGKAEWLHDAANDLDEETCGGPFVVKRVQEDCTCGLAQLLDAAGEGENSELIQTARLLVQDCYRLEKAITRMPQWAEVLSRLMDVQSVVPRLIAALTSAPKKEKEIK